MADIRVKDLTEATVPGPDYYLLTDSATDGVKKVQTKNVVKPADIGAASLTGVETLTNKTLTAPVINSPTGIVKADIGLGNVDNTSDATKNATTATLTNKTLTGPVINSPTGIVKGDVGLGNVDNTSDATKNAAAVALTNKDLTSGTNTFPTFNQNTTGSAAKLTTARNIDGQAFDGSADITVIAPGTHVATSKTTPVDADELPLVDSAASNVLKKLTWANLKAGLPPVVGDGGLGGTKGLVPAPAAGDAAAGKFLKADGTFAVPAGGTGSVSVADRTALKALSTSGASTVILLEAGREGAFTLRSGSVPLSDPNEGVYVASNTAGFYWERLAHNRTFNVRWFGAVLDNSTDDTSAIQAAIDFAALFTGTTVGPRAGIYCPSGFLVKTTSKLSLDIPIKVDFRSVINYNNTSGRAVFINESEPADASQFSYWDLFFQGFYANPASGAFPASIDTGGPIAISIRGMIFSKLEVREGIGFGNKFVEWDCTGTTYPSNNQIVLHNHFIFGQIANNGLGLSAKSLDAATSCFEGNRISIQQINQNCFNIVDGDGTYQASTSNTWDINAMDNETQVGIDTYCKYNKWYVGFSGSPGTTLRTNAGCDYSRFEFGNNETTDIVLNDNGGGNHNQYILQNPSALPGTQTVASGIAYQNTFGVPVTVSVAVSGGGQVDMRVDSPDGTETLVGNAKADGFITFPVLPHGWKWKLFTTSGTVTYGTAHIFHAI